MTKTLISLALLFSFFVNAQKNADVVVKLRDGQEYKGTSNFSDISFKTKYGVLTIPVQDISIIKTGISVDKSIKEKVESLLKGLSVPAEDARKTNYDEILKFGLKAIPIVDNFLMDPKNSSETTYESYTADNLLSELKSQYNIETVTTEDEITLNENFYVSGNYEFSKLEVKTEFGVMSIPKEKIKEVQVSYSDPNNKNEITIKLLANKHISGNTNGGWYNTGIRLKSGQKFSIIASGEVTLASLSNQKYKPNGSVSSSSVTDETSEEVSNTATYDYGYPTYGNVVYRIGDANKYDNKKAGAKFSGNAYTSGLLYVSIYETVYNAENTGSYTVKISVK